MKQAPATYTARALKLWDVSYTTKELKGEWRPARPEGYSGFLLWFRFKAAWSVFTGRNDVLKWD